jgi:hypothetical protein
MKKQTKKTLWIVGIIFLVIAIGLALYFSGSLQQSFLAFGGNNARFNSELGISCNQNLKICSMSPSASGYFSEVYGSAESAGFASSVIGMFTSSESSCIQTTNYGNPTPGHPQFCDIERLCYGELRYNESMTFKVYGKADFWIGMSTMNPAHPHGFAICTLNESQFYLNDVRTNANDYLSYTRNGDNYFSAGQITISLDLNKMPGDIPASIVPYVPEQPSEDTFLHEEPIVNQPDGTIVETTTIPETQTTIITTTYSNDTVVTITTSPTGTSTTVSQQSFFTKYKTLIIIGSIILVAILLIIIILNLGKKRR